MKDTAIIRVRVQMAANASGDGFSAHKLFGEGWTQPRKRRDKLGGG